MQNLSHALSTLEPARHALVQSMLQEVSKHLHCNTCRMHGTLVSLPALPWLERCASGGLTMRDAC
jgi:hypothetical protein